MNRELTNRRVQRALPLLGLLVLMACTAVGAQVPVDEYGNPLAAVERGAVLDAAELEVLVGPVALYPDDLLAIVLPASTYPLQIVQAARFLERLEEDSSLKPDENWDDSIVALLNYPEVVDMMNEDLDWTWRLGEAVVAQQPAVVSAVESFRDQAWTAGNLKSDEHQSVSRSEGVIEIAPLVEDVIYVPYYEPARVVVYSPRPEYHYYPRAYPLYYYPYSPGHNFRYGFFWGVSTAFAIGWSSDYLHVYHHSYHGHPYYGNAYYGHHYRRPSIHRHNHHYINNYRRPSRDPHRNGDHWRPQHSGGARPGHHVARDNYYDNNERRSQAAVDSNRPPLNTDTRREYRNRDSGRRPEERPALTLRQRDDRSYRGSARPRLERSQDSRSQRASPPVIQASHSRSTARPSKPPSMAFATQRSGSHRSNRQARPRVSPPPRQATARTQPRPSSSGRPPERKSRLLASNHKVTSARNRRRPD